MTTTATPAAGDGLPELIEDLLAAEDGLDRARWLTEALSMVLDHETALPCGEDLPVAELMRVVIDRVTTAASEAGSALDRARTALTNARNGVTAHAVPVTPR